MIANMCPSRFYAGQMDADPLQKKETGMFLSKPVGQRENAADITSLPKRAAHGAVCSRIHYGGTIHTGEFCVLCNDPSVSGIAYGFEMGGILQTVFRQGVSAFGRKCKKVQ